MYYVVGNSSPKLQDTIGGIWSDTRHWLRYCHCGNCVWGVAWTIADLRLSSSCSDWYSVYWCTVLVYCCTGVHCPAQLSYNNCGTWVWIISNGATRLCPSVTYKFQLKFQYTSAIIQQIQHKPQSVVVCIISVN